MLHYTGHACLQFSYYISGDDIGYLYVYLGNDTDSILLWQEGVYSYEGWQTAYVSLNFTHHYMVGYASKDL